MSARYWRTIAKRVVLRERNDRRDSFIVGWATGGAFAVAFAEEWWVPVVASGLAWLFWDALAIVRTHRRLSRHTSADHEEANHG